MFTAEQLYEIISARTAYDAGSEKRRERKAGEALYSLWGRYKNKQPEGAEEYAFSAALGDLLDKAESSVKNGARKETLGTAVSEELSRFNAAYDALPGPLRRVGPVKEAFDAVDRALDPDKAAFERRMAVLMEDIVRENDTVKQIWAGTHAAQTAPKPLSREQLDRLEAQNTQNLRDDLATLLAMDNLRKAGNGDLKDALDPECRKAETEKVKKSVEFRLALTAVEQRALNTEGLGKAFGDIGRSELAARVAAAAETLEARKQLNQEKEQEFRRDFQELAEGTVRAYNNLKQIQNRTHPAFQNELMTAEDLKDLKEKNEEIVRANLATIVVMDQFRRNGDFASATDPERLEAAVDMYMEEKSEGLDIAIRSLTGSGKIDLEALFRRDHKPELAVLMGVAKTSVEQKDRLAAQVGPDGPKETREQIKETREQTKSSEPSASPDSPLMRFQAKLAELKNAVGPSGEGGSRNQTDLSQLRQGLQTLFALRVLCETDPKTPVTDDQVREQRLRLMNDSREASKLCRGVLRIKDRYRLEKVVDAIQGNESPEEFLKNVRDAAGLRKAYKKRSGPDLM